MRAKGEPALAVDIFSRHLNAIKKGVTGFLTKHEIKPIENIPHMEELSCFSNEMTLFLKKTVIIKLNGGLGTSMGLSTAKSLLPAKKEVSFLDIIARQVLHLNQKFGIKLPLVLMNSFQTRDESLKTLTKYPGLSADLPPDFLQHQIPKIRQDTYLSAEYPQEPNHEWCPPGHGDIYAALVTSGILEKMLKKGYEYAFVSNSDNLGATLNLDILNWFAVQECPFLMEVANRTVNDRKGGHLAQLSTGRLTLRELAQCPPDERRSFQDIKTFHYFNTNTLWINLKQLWATLYEREYFLDLPLIINRKPVNPSADESTPVIQLETAMGSAISLFSKAAVIRVPRDRFIPVKTTNDLLVLWSDLCELGEDYSIRPAPGRLAGDFEVDLDPRYFGRIDQLKAHFPNGVPSLKQYRKFIVKDDTTFEPDADLKGFVDT